MVEYLGGELVLFGFSFLCFGLTLRVVLFCLCLFAWCLLFFVLFFACLLCELRFVFTFTCLLCLYYELVCLVDCCLLSALVLGDVV